MAKIKIGITGGIASGKSFVAKYISSLNFPVFDADFLTEQVYQDLFFQEKILSNLPQFLSPVNKKNMKKYLTFFPENLSILEAIIHPMIEEKFFEISDKFPSYFFYEATLILEKNLIHRFNYCLVCHSPGPLRRERFLNRKNATTENFDFFSKHQFSDQERLKACDENSKLVLIDTSRTEDFTRSQVDNFLKKITGNELKDKFA